MRLSIILVNWNNSDDTQACLQSLAVAQALSQEMDVQIVVVDNHSDPAERARLATIEDTLDKATTTFLHRPGNGGLAAGYNTGIRYCLEHFHPDAIWLLNNDTRVDAQCLAVWQAALSAHPHIRIWGSTIYTMNTPPALFCTGGFRYHAALSIPFPLREQSKVSREDLYQRLPGMDYVSGISMCVKADCFVRHGLLDESYFLYYEELELVRQCRGRDAIAWCPASIVYHKGGGSTGSHDPNRGMGSPMAHYYGNRSALVYTRRHHPWFLPLVVVLRLIAKSALFVRYGEWSGFKPLLLAYRDFFLGRPARSPDSIRS